MAKRKNKQLHKAKVLKNDEFYTQLTDIEKEVKYYRDHFKGKTVLCNCDDPIISNFFYYFALNFENLGLKKLISTCYKNNQVLEFTSKKVEKSMYIEYYGPKNGRRIPILEEMDIKYLKGDGDFRSPECIKFLEEADIICTNPPFSLFREYVAQLMKYKKKFLIVGPSNAVTYKEIFPLIKNSEIWLGCNYIPSFDIPDGGIKKFGNVCWFTNLPHKKRNEELILYRKYQGNEKDYPKYDNYDAIEVSKVSNIPIDYDGNMGVPISFLDKYNPNQFEIIDINPHFFYLIEQGITKPSQLKIKGQKDPYARILIRRRNRE